MKLSFSTVMCMEQDPYGVIELCKKYGLDGIEVRMNDKKIFRMNDVELNGLAVKLKEKNISVPIVGTSVCLKKYDSEQIQDAFSCIDSATLLGASGIRVFLGNFAAKRNAPHELLEHDGIVRALREICEYGAKKNILVCVETHNEYATGRALAVLKKDVGSLNLKFIWDIIHPIEDGEKISETWEYIGNDIVHVHIKDGFDRDDSLWHDFCYTPLGEGSLPIYSVLKLLDKNDFDGFVSLEWEEAWRTELKELGLTYEKVLGDFGKFVSQSCDNMIPKIGSSDWKTFTPFEDSGSMHADGESVGLEITVDSGLCSLHRWECTVAVTEKETYDFSVKYMADGLRNPQAVYAMLSVMDKNGKILQREYADHSCKGALVKKIRIYTGGCSVRIELGLKCNGRVVWYEPNMSRKEPAGSRKVKVVTTYINSYSTENSNKYTAAQNAERIGSLIDKAANEKPDLILLAETVNDRGAIVENEAEIYESEDGIYCTTMRKKAREHNCFIMFTYHELCRGKRYNTAVLLDRSGNIVGRYHKSHLTITEYEMGLTPGDELPVFDTEIGKIGILICYDGYFPEPARILASKGAELILVSTAGDAAHRMVARAMENGVYVAVSCVCNTHVHGFLPSKIINPRGEVLAQTDEDFSYASAEIDLNEKSYINWLSVGPCDGEPKNVYAHERQTNFYGDLQKEIK